MMNMATKALPCLCVWCCIPAHVRAEDAAAHPPKRIVTTTGVDMVLVPGGWFVMGNDKGQKDEAPAHKVYLSPFYMDRHEVTQKHFEKMTGGNPSKFGGAGNPVDRVSWYEAIECCNERSRREGLSPCYDPETGACRFEANGYRLPTEAEWECACRAGTKTAYFFGDEDRTLKTYAWFKANSAEKTHPVGQKKENALGLCDIVGNLREWCNDFYAEASYRDSPERDPRGPAAGMKRVLRGGCWATGAEACRSSARFADDPQMSDICLGYDTYGFRCVKAAGPGPAK